MPPSLSDDEVRRLRLRVVVEPFEAIPSPAREALAVEAEDVARFYGRQGTLEIAG